MINLIVNEIFIWKSNCDLSILLILDINVKIKIKLIKISFSKNKSVFMKSSTKL